MLSLKIYFNLVGFEQKLKHKTSYNNKHDDTIALNEKFTILQMFTAR